jgi:hypothetical protein
MEKDMLAQFKNWYLNSGQVNKIFTPFKNPLLFIEGVSGVVLYRKKPFQVELFICQPNTFIPEHTHPDVDSFELFLYGMKFTHSGRTVINLDEALEQTNDMPTHAYKTIRVKPNDIHGGTSSKNGGAFISIQHWLNDIDPSHVSSNWSGDTMGKEHKLQTGL